ncbi:MAG: hypothetical protein QOG89_1612 [Thermomicrobiales bacterium]|nr:hypothetical protein [Thermomicrobiales bacterium]
MRKEALGAVLYDLIDLETGMVVGRVTGAGDVISGDAQVTERVTHAFAREVMVRDGELVEELGICFANVETLYPGQPGHEAAVLRYLGKLSGYLPQVRDADGP